MLAHVAAPRLDSERSSAVFQGGEVEVELVHAERPEWTIHARCDEHEGIVSTGAAHDDFGPHYVPAGGRPWTSSVVDFVAEILRGEIEIVAAYRGDALLNVRTYLLDEEGERERLGYVGYLEPPGLLVWRRKRTEIERPSFL